MSGRCGPSRGGERAGEDLGFYLGGKGLPGGPALKNPPANAGVTGLIPVSGKYPGEGNGLFLPGKSHGKRDLVGYSP